MRLALAFAVMGLVAACGAFGTNDDEVGAVLVDAGMDAAKAKPVDASMGSEADAGATSCAPIIENPFANTASVGGWTQQSTNASVDFIAGPQGLPALFVGAHSTGNALSRSYFDRSVTQQAIRSVHAEFDFAYQVLEPAVAFGCVTNLARSAPFGEARLSLQLDDTGFAGAGGFGDNSGPGSVETEALDLPPAATWTHVSFDLALANDGFVESKLRVDTLEKAMPRYLPPGSGAFDGVHVLCGVVGLRGADSRASIYLKSLVVIACKPS